MEKLSPRVLQRVQVLKQIQSGLSEIEAEFFEMRRKLENKYQKKFQPFYTKRYEIVNGVSKVIKSSNELADQGVNKPAEEIGIPNFWLTVMKSNEVVAEMIQKHDEDALRYLKDIEWSRVEVTKDMYPEAKATEGFKFEFLFDRNPYFKNSVLSKTYCMVDEDNDIMEIAIGTTIEWFPGKCLTNTVLSKSKFSRGRMITTLDSFFNFFNPVEMPDNDDDNMVETVISLMQPDYNAAVSLREDIIPHAVFWFTEGNSDNESGVNIVDITNSHKNAKAKKLPDIVLKNVELLEQIQDEHDELEYMFFDARRKLEDKYLKRCQPLFRKRYEIVNGIKPADQGEIKSAEEKGVPNFWLTALKANTAVAKVIRKQDEEVLKYLKDIRTEIEWLVERHMTAVDSFFQFIYPPKIT